ANVRLDDVHLPAGFSDSLSEPRRAHGMNEPRPLEQDAGIRELGVGARGIELGAKLLPDQRGDDLDEGYGALLAFAGRIDGRARRGDLRVCAVSLLSHGQLRRARWRTGRNGLLLGGGDKRWPTYELESTPAEGHPRRRLPCACSESSRAGGTRNVRDPRHG